MQGGRIAGAEETMVAALVHGDAALDEADPEEFLKVGRLTPGSPRLVSAFEAKM